MGGVSIIPIFADDWKIILPLINGVPLVEFKCIYFISAILIPIMFSRLIKRSKRQFL